MPIQSGYPSAQKEAAKEQQRPLYGKKVLLGVAAGDAVLSRMAALFLKEQGAKVSLIHLKLGPLAQYLRYGKNAPDLDENLLRAWSKDQGMDLDIVDLSEESDAFCQGWIRLQMSQAWMPDIRSNFEGRFLMAQLYHYAKEAKAELSTGHRARVVHEANGTLRILKSTDESIDQSALLGFTKSIITQKLHLPVGYIKADEARKLTSSYKLSEKVDRLFEDRNIAREFEEFEKFVSLQSLPRVRSKGYVISAKKVILGDHAGLASAAVGEKRHFEELKETPTRTVLGHDIMKNWVIVGTEDQLDRTVILSSPVNWLFQRPDLTRSQERLNLNLSTEPDEFFDVTVELVLGSGLRITRAEGQKKSKPFRPRLGSTFTLYRGTLCLGSARVVETFV